MKVDGVFEGGGMKFIGLVGAACYLEEKGYEWYQAAGTSSGSIVASMLIAGYKALELKDILMNTNFEKFLDESKIKIISPISKSIGFLKNKGIHSGDPLEDYIRELLERKGKVKFKDVSENGKSRLKIIASDITQQKMMILPDDIINYGIDPMELEIAKAIRMSISIPFYFKPVKLEYNKKQYSFVVDGGILSNFPIWIFDVYGAPRWPTLGFKLISTHKHIPDRKNDFVSFTFDIIDTMIEKNEDVYIRNKDAVRTIFIPTLDAHTTQFNMSKEMKSKLFYSGYRSAEEFLNTWDFSQYIKKYRT